MPAHWWLTFDRIEAPDDRSALSSVRGSRCVNSSTSRESRRLRYDLVDCGTFGNPWREMRRDPDGEWVRFEDVQAVLAAPSAQEEVKP